MSDELRRHYNACDGILLAGKRALNLYNKNKPIKNPPWEIHAALERALEIISEASRKLLPSEKEKYPHIEWAKISAFGNVIRHEYSKVENKIVSNILEAHISDLLKAVSEMILEKNKGNNHDTV